MADSNKPSQPKTFLQQFEEYATAVNQHSSMLSQAEKLMSIVTAAIKGIVDEQKMINDQLQAIMVLAENKILPTRESVLDKIQELRVLESKSRLLKDEKDGIIKKIDSVTGDDSIVVFSDPSQDYLYAYNPVASFPEDTRKQLIGKKAGDTVGTISIIEVYSLVDKEEEKQPEQQV